jgi:hypothetical protein
VRPDVHQGCVRVPSKACVPCAMGLSKACIAGDRSSHERSGRDVYQIAWFVARAAPDARTQVSRSCACIGSPCLRHCVHGASIGALGGSPSAASRAAAPVSAPVGRAFPSCTRSVLTEIFLCHACSCREFEVGNALGQGGGGHRRAVPGLRQANHAGVAAAGVPAGRIAPRLSTS